jgi:predicted DNA-binding transcriptional regulator YafY
MYCDEDGPMRASRLLTIQMLLQTRGRMSAPALAAALEVSLRTLYRDVDQLSAAGVPIYAERGRSGGYQLQEGWKTSLTGLTPSESQAVFLTGLGGPAAQLGLGPQVETAKLKLLAALPAGWRDDAQRISSKLHLDPVDWYRESEPVPQLQPVADAVWREQRLSIRYESWKASATRRIDPLGLVIKAGTWYLVAGIGEQARTFRVSNIGEAQLLDEPVRRPKRFDLAAYWAESIRRFERELYQGEATVLATPAGLKGLSHLGQALAKAVAAVAPRTRRRDGRTRLRIPIETIEHATGQLLRLAPEVEVIEPAALRAAIAQRVRQVAALYGCRISPFPAAASNAARRSPSRAGR